MKTDSKIGAISILSLLVVLLCSLATGTPSHVFPSGYLTGEGFRKMSETERFAYSEGLIDGFLTAPSFSAASQSWKKFYRCLTQTDFDKQLGGNVAPSRSMSNEQVTAILDKYLAEHPESWHLPMNALGISAFYTSCGIKRGASASSPPVSLGDGRRNFDPDALLDSIGVPKAPPPPKPQPIP